METQAARLVFGSPAVHDCILLINKDMTASVYLCAGIPGIRWNREGGAHPLLSSQENRNAPDHYHRALGDAGQPDPGAVLQFGAQRGRTTPSEDKQNNCQGGKLWL